MRSPQQVDSLTAASTSQLTPAQVTWAKVIGRALGQMWLTEARQHLQDAQLAAPSTMPDAAQASHPDP